MRGAPQPSPAGGRGGGGARGGAAPAAAPTPLQVRSGTGRLTQVILKQRKKKSYYRVMETAAHHGSTKKE